MKSPLCSLIGHKLIVKRFVTLNIKEYVCKTCKEEFTTSVNGHIVPLTERRKETNLILERVYKKKLMRVV